MKIDEAINFVENMMYLYRPTGEHHDKWCELLNLLRWYREQDLVTREDVSQKMYWLDVEDLVKQIPKAEPPKEA